MAITSIAVGSCIVIHPNPASAAVVATMVLGTAMLWNLTANPGLPYDTSDYGSGPGTGPTIIAGDFTIGSAVLIAASGIVSTGPTNPSNGPSGIPGDPNCGFGSGCPSDDTPGPNNVGELIGAFANPSGVVVGTPFVVGDGGTFTTTGNASELLLGINDDDYGNNSGSFRVVASGSGVTPVPLPSSAPMFGAALLALGAIGYGLKRRETAAVS